MVAYRPLPGEFSSGPPPTGVANYNASLPIQCGFGTGGVPSAENRIAHASVPEADKP